LTIAHQYIEQMSDEVRAAVFGNVGTMIVFRIGAYDAEVLEKEFAPKFTSEDIVNLGIFQIYLKLMIDGVASQPFSATTMPPIASQSVSFHDKIIEESRKAFGRPRAEVEKDVIAQSGGQGDILASTAAFPRTQNVQQRPAPVAGFARSENSVARPQPQTVPRAQTPRPLLSPSDGFSSLKDIAAKIPQKKAGTEEHKQNLRAALSDVLKKQPEKASTAGGVHSDSLVRFAPTTRSPERTPPAATPKVNGSQKQEVPEDVLRNILDESN
jgi:hypothetical protein